MSSLATKVQADDPPILRKHTESATMFLTWPVQFLVLARNDKDLGQAIDKLADYAARWERLGAEQLRIVRAAIRLGNAVYSVPPPGRHGDVFRIMPPASERGDDEEQGFLASNGQFYSREIALHVARDAKQLIRKTPPDSILFSEDLW